MTGTWFAVAYPNIYSRPLPIQSLTGNTTMFFKNLSVMSLKTLFGTGSLYFQFNVWS